MADRPSAHRRTGNRLLWAIAGAAALAVLAAARALAPDPSGMGTHVQLGLPPCGWLYLTGLPCPTCGLTTAFAHMARLQVTSAFSAHALGPVLFAMTAAAIPIAAWGIATDAPVARAIERLRLAKVAAIIAAAAVVSWLLRLGSIWSA